MLNSHFRSIPILALTFAGLTFAPASSSAQVTWSTATTVVGDTDVINVGAGYAYTWAAAAQTVNGAIFSPAGSNTSVGGGNVTMSGFDGLNTTAFTSTVAPFTNLSASYKAMLIGAAYTGGATALTTVNLNNLVTGRTYVVQLWAGDPRGTTLSARQENIIGTNTVLLNYGTSNVTGSLGQYTLGTFTATGSTVSFNMQGAAAGSSTQVNALQLREIDGIWSGATDGNWDANSLNFTGGKSYSTVTTVTNNFSFGDTDGLRNAVTNTTITIQATGVADINVFMQGLTKNYTFQNASGSIGISGISTVTKTGSSLVTLLGANTYTGTTSLLGGTVNLGVAETAGVSGPLGAQAANAAGSIILGGGTLQSSAVNTFDYSGRFSTAASQQYRIDTNGQNVTWATPLVSSGGQLTKSGAGTLILTGANTYTGTSSITGGTLQLDPSGSISNAFQMFVGNATAGNLVINGGSFTSSFGGNTALDIAPTAGVVGAVTFSSGTISLTGSAGMNVGAVGTGTFTQTGGTFTAGTGGVYVGDGSTAATGTIDISGGTFTSVLATNVLATRGKGTFNISGTAQVTLGTLQFGHTAGSGQTSTLNLNGGTLTLASITRAISNPTGTATLNLNGGTITASAASTAFISGLNAINLLSGGVTINDGGFAIAISQPFLEAAPGGGGFTKSGGGTLTITGANTYTGPTNITAGKLAINGTFSTTGSVSVAANATLASNGSAGAVTVADTGTLEAGFGGVGNFAPTSLTFGGTSTVNIGTLGNYSSSAAIIVGGSLAANGAANSITLNIAALGNVTTGSTYKLISYTGAIGGAGFGAFQLSATPLPNRATAVLVNNAGSVGVTITSVGILKWTGTGSLANGWDTSTQNWMLSSDSSPTTFFNSPADIVVFDDSASALNTAITIGTLAVTPTSVTVNSNANNYTFSGSFGITGTTSLIKSGTSTLTLTNTNSFTGGLIVTGGIVALNAAQSFTGGVTINGGVVAVGNATALNSNPVTFGPAVAPGTKLQLNGFNATVSGLSTNNTVGSPVIESGSIAPGTDTLTLNNTVASLYAGVLQNGGTRLLALAKTGAGSLTLTGINTHTGGTTLTTGTLNLNGTNVLGGGTFIIAGGTIDNTSGAAITLATNNAQSWNANFTFAGTNNLNLGTGTATINAARTVTVTAGTLTVGGPVAGSFALTKAGAGSLVFAAANTYTGSTTINGGTLQLATGSSIINTTQMLVGSASAGNLIVNGGSFSTSFAGNSAINIGVSAGVTGTLTLTTGSISLTASAGMVVGSGGTGTYIQTGGTFTSGTNGVWLGDGSTAATGTIDISGGTFTSVLGTTVIATRGKGTFNVGGNAVVTLSTVQFAHTAGSNQTATLNLNGGTLTVATMNRAAGTATFNFNGGVLKPGASATNFMTGLSAANVLDNGAIIDTGVFNITIAQPLLHGGVNATDGGLIVRGTGILTLTGSSTFTGLTDVQSGTLAYGADNLIPDTNNLRVSGGTLALGAFNDTFATVQLTGGSITSSTGTLTSPSNFDVQSGSISAILTGGVGLVKTTSGTVTLSAANSYTGQTAVSAGKLVVNGSLNPSSAVNVAANATLGGSGTVGAVTVAANGILEGGAAGTGTLNLSSLNFLAAGTINIATLSNNASVASLNVTGVDALNPAGGANSITINVVSLGTVTVGSTYKILSYAGTITGSGTAAFKINTPLPSRAIGTLVNNAGEIDLKITALDFLKWTGSGTLANGWDTTTQNWKLSSDNTPTTYFNTPADAVVFDDSAIPANTTVNLNTVNVTPTSVIFNNSTNNYTLQGTFGISGLTSLVKNGNGSLTLANTNSFTGGLVVNAGTVNLTAAQSFTGGVIINGGVVILGNANAFNSNALLFGPSAALGTKLQLNGNNLTLSSLSTNSVPGAPAIESGSSVAGTDVLTVDSALSNVFAGNLQDGGVRLLALVKSGSGTLALAGANTLSGGITLGSGVLALNSANALGTGALTINGGNLDNTSGSAVTIATATPQTWNTDIRFIGSSDLNIGSGTIAMGANRTVTVTAGNLTVGALTGTGFTLTKLGSGTLTISGASTYTGLTTVSAGTLTVTGSVASTASVTVGNPAAAADSAMIVAGGSVTVPGDFLIGGNGFQSVTANLASFTITGGSITIGASGTTFALGQNINGTTLVATFTQSGGTVTVNSTGFLGLANGGGVSNMTVSGGTFTSAGALMNLGVRGNATLNISNSGLVTLPSITYAHPSTAGGTSVVNLGDGTNFSQGTSGTLVVGGLTRANGTATFNFNGGTLKASAANTAFFSTNITANVLDAGGIIDNNNFAITIGQSFVHGGVATIDGGLVFRGAGTTTLSSTQNYTGPTVVQAGTLQYGNNDIINDIASVKVSGGSLNLGSFSDSVAGVALISGSIVGTGTLTSTSTFDVRSGSINVNLNGIDGTVGLAKTTTDTVMLNGGNFFSGPTTISAGKLIVNGSYSTSSTIAVAAGATLAGTSSVGSTTVAANGSIEAGSGGTGTLTISDLTFAGAGTLTLGVVANYSSAPGVFVQNGNALVLSAGANSLKINVGSLVGITLNTPYKVIGYNGILGGTGFSAFQLSPLPSRAIGSLVNNPGEVDLILTSIDFLKWTGSASNAWNTTATNWILGSNAAPATYINTPGDSVVFDDTAAAANTTVNLATLNVTPASVVFANNLRNYTLQGTFGITGPTGVVMNGSGSLTMSNTNSFTGGLIVNSGTVILAATQSFSGGLTITGGTVSINAAQSYTGGTSLSVGTLNVNHASALSSGPLTILSGTIDNTSGAAISLATNNTQTWSGDFTFTGSNDLTFGTGAVTLTVTPTVTVNAGTLTVRGGISGLGLALLKSGNGTLVLAGAGTFGQLTVNAGTLRIAAPQNILVGILVNDGTLEIAQGGSVPASNAITLASSTATLLHTVGATTAGGQIGIGNFISGSGNWTLKPALSTDYSVTGDTTGFNGTLTINNNARLNLHSGTVPAATTVVVNAGGQFYMGGYNLASAISLAGTGWAEGAGSLGAIRSEGGTISGNITLTANASIGAYRSSSSYTGTITGNFELEMRSGVSPASDTITLSPPSQNTYGSTSVNNANATTTSGNITLRAGTAGAFSTGGLTLKGTNASSLAILQLNGFDFAFANLTSGNAFTQIQNASATPVTMTIGSDSTNTLYSGTIIDGSTGTLSLNKVGTGTLTLTAANTYTGATTVTAGMLKGSGSIASAVTVNSGATLAAGTGTGSTARTFTTGAVTFNSGSNFQTQLFSAAAGDMGSLVSTGAITFADPLTRFKLDLTNITHSSMAVSQTYTVISGQSLTVNGGNLNSSNIDLVNNTGGFLNSEWSLSLAPGGNALQLTYSPAPVPEPATLLAFGAGLLGLGGYIRRRMA